MKKLAAVFLALAMCFCLCTVPAYAASVSRDGLDVTLTTDKEAYSQNESIFVTLTATNITETAIEGVSLENVIPEGYSVAPGSEALLQVGTVEPGETVTLQVTLVPSTVEPTPTPSPSPSHAPGSGPQTGDNATPGLWIALLVVAVIALAGTLFLTRKYWKRILSIVLCVAMLGGLGIGLNTPAEAVSESKTLRIETLVTVEGVNLTITGLVTYMGESSNPGLDDPNPEVEIFSFAADKDSIPVNVEETVLFTAEVFSDLELEEDIQVVSSDGVTIGSMNDDGTDGDAVRFDGIYTLQTTLSSDSEKSVEYWATVGEVESRKVTIEFYEGLSEEDVAAMQEVDERVGALMSDPDFMASSKEDQVERMRALLEELEKEGLILADSIEYYDDTYEFYFTYKCGIPGGVVLKELGSGLDGAETTEAALNEIDQGADIEFSNAEEDPDSESGGESFDIIAGMNTVTYSLTGKRELKVLLLNGFEDTPFRNDFYNRVESEWDEMGLETRLDNNVTVGDMKSCASNDYDIIVFSMHGTELRGGNNGQKVSGMVLDEEATDSGYKNELSHSDSLRKVSFIGHSSPSYVIMPGFFGRYLYGTFDNKFVFAQCCAFFGCDCRSTTPDYALANAIINCSAEALVGYHNSVQSEYGRNVMEYTVEELFDGKTVQESLDNARNRYGQNDNSSDPSNDKHIAYPIIAGNPQFKFVRTGTIAGNVINAADSSPITNALIRVYRENEMVTSARTNSTGEYRINKIEPGIYIIKISAGHYKSVKFAVTVLADQVTYNATALLIQSSVFETGIARGTVRNAITGMGVGGVEVKMRRNWNNETGAVLYTTSTNENGYYEIEYEPGFYTLEFSKSGFITVYKNVIVLVDYTDQDATITPLGQSDVYRIVLTWAKDPRDLDSHVVGELSDGEPFHVYYMHQSQYDGDTEVCNLDVDDVDSYGPETVTLNTMTSKPYYYYVYRYAGEGTVASSNAQVKVYRGTQLINTFNVPTDMGSGDYWNLFAIVDGQLIIKNTITDSADLSYAGYQFSVADLNGRSKVKIAEVPTANEEGYDELDQPEEETDAPVEPTDSPELIDPVEPEDPSSFSTSFRNLLSKIRSIYLSAARF